MLTLLSNDSSIWTSHASAEVSACIYFSCKYHSPRLISNGWITISQVNSSLRHASVTSDNLKYERSFPLVLLNPKIITIKLEGKRDGLSICCIIIQFIPVPSNSVLGFLLSSRNYWICFYAIMSGFRRNDSSSGTIVTTISVQHAPWLTDGKESLVKCGMYIAHCWIRYIR